MNFDFKKYKLLYIIDDRLEYLYTTIGIFLENKQYDIVDDIIVKFLQERNELDDFIFDDYVGLLTVTYLYKDKLPNRYKVYDKLVNDFEATYNMVFGLE